MEAKISYNFFGNCVRIASIVYVVLSICGCSRDRQPSGKSISEAGAFKADVDFLKKYTEVIVLQSASGSAKVAVSPALQGRVMTSTSEGDGGLSYGWINRKAFLSGDTSNHMNAFGGEDRFWLGPEGGQFSIYFEKGTTFDFDHWHVPKLIDTEPFALESVSETEAIFTKDAELTNYSGTVFKFNVNRKVKIIPAQETFQATGLSTVAYETVNTLKNTGANPWTKDTGLLSIWILGMYNPSENTTVVIPHDASGKMLREIVNDNYFGSVPENRLKSDGNVVYFRADGGYRSKIGLAPQLASEWMGSYDADNNVLTLVRYNKPQNLADYVNSSWQIQKEPFRGDVINAYNDGAPSPGVEPMGPFYELESSSPAAALLPGASITHIHTTYHIQGSPQQLDPIALKILGVSIKQITEAFQL